MADRDKPADRDAIERSVRAARAAWDGAGGEPVIVEQQVVVAAVLVPDDAGRESPLDDVVDRKLLARLRVRNREGERRLGDEVDVEAEVGADARRRLAALLRLDSSDDDPADAGEQEVALQARARE